MCGTSPGRHTKTFCFSPTFQRISAIEFQSAITCSFSLGLSSFSSGTWIVMKLKMKSKFDQIHEWSTFSHRFLFGPVIEDEILDEKRLNHRLEPSGRILGSSETERIFGRIMSISDASSSPLTVKSLQFLSIRNRTRLKMFPWKCKNISNFTLAAVHSLIRKLAKRSNGMKIINFFNQVQLKSSGFPVQYLSAWYPDELQSEEGRRRKEKWWRKKVNSCMT